MAETGPGDGRSIENPTDPSDTPDELEEGVRSDADHAPAVEGDRADDAGTEGEAVEEQGDGLTTEQGVNEESS